MADRNEFLGQLQKQLGAWADWVRQLDDQALSATAQVRADTKAAYAERATQVKDLIRQGRAQWERVSGATDEAWQGISNGAEQAWTALQDAAAGLAMQTLPVSTELQPAIQQVSAMPRPRSKPRAKPAKKRGVQKQAKAATRPARTSAAKKSARKKSARKASGKRASRKPARKK